MRLRLNKMPGWFSFLLHLEHGPSRLAIGRVGKRHHLGGTLGSAAEGASRLTARLNCAGLWHWAEVSRCGEESSRGLLWHLLRPQCRRHQERSFAGLCSGWFELDLSDGSGS
jgi:hypothetical protein